LTTELPRSAQLRDVSCNGATLNLKSQAWLSRNKALEDSANGFGAKRECSAGREARGEARGSNPVTGARIFSLLVASDRSAGQFSGECTHPWAVAANSAAAAGVVTVAAAGNENYANALSSPACGADVIAVGATYEDSYPNCQSGTSSFNWGSCVDVNPNRDDVVCFSNESSDLDVVAPGCEIWSASNDPGGTWITGTCGTSMSSPMVAGLAALVLDIDDSLSPAQVRQRIRNGAIDMGPAGFDTAYGHGRIDVVRTLAASVGCSSDADCDDALFCTGTETCVGGSCQSSGDPCSGGGVCNEATETCDVPVCDDDGICEAGEDCANCPNDCRQKTNGSPNRRYCCDGDLPDCGDSRCSESGWSCEDDGFVVCTSDPECDDGQFCNGVETCSGESAKAAAIPAQAWVATRSAISV